MRGFIEELIRREVEKWWATRYSERHGIVTSYDSKKHLAKVMYQPEGIESGWIPIETGHIGKGFGFAVGLTPGDGKKSGDQVIIRHQEGDFESGKIVQRVHSDEDNPPEVKAGEAVFWTKPKKKDSGGSSGGSGSSGGGGGQQQSETTGQKIFFAEDGSLTFEDGSGASLKFDGKGNITINANNVTHNVKKTETINAETINTVGNTHLGSTGGVQMSKKGTMDVGGHADIANQASKVWAT